MPAFSDYLEAAILNAIFRGVPFTSPSQLYVGLFSADPTDAGTGPELDGTSYPGYARVSISSGNWIPPTAGAGASQVANNASVDFPAATANWPNPVTHFGLFDSSSGGNLLIYGPLVTPRSLFSGDNVRFPASGLTVTLD